MRTLLVLAALLATSLAAPLANAGDGTNCPGTVTVTSASPGSVSSGPGLNVRVVFAGDGPGYIPDQCDIGWITTCTLVVNGQNVSHLATCRHTDGDDRCHEISSPYVCEMEMTAFVPAATGTYLVEATLGMTWGCCLWQGGPEARATSTRAVTHLQGV